MKRFISLSVSLLLTLLLAAGMFSVTALADEVIMPDSVTIPVGKTSVIVEFTIKTSYGDIPESVFGDNGKIVLTNQNDSDSAIAGIIVLSTYRNATNAEGAEYRYTGQGTIEITLTVSGAPAGTYTGNMNWQINDASGTLTVTYVIPGEDESSEESSEPEESSEAPAESISDTEGSSAAEEESSATEEESSAAEEESSAAESESESESESSQSSKTSKASNPGKPDELNMGGSTASASDSKPAPDTGFGNAPLAALGVAAMAGLAVIAFRKK